MASLKKEEVSADADGGFVCVHYSPLKLVITPQSCTSPVLSPIYATLLQKRNSLAVLVQQPEDSHHVQVIKVHQVSVVSLRYNHSPSICLKYFPSLVVGDCQIQASQYPLCWHKENT